MKNWTSLLLMVAILFLAACNSKTSSSVTADGSEEAAPVYSNKPGHYGVEITPDGAVPVNAISQKVSELGSGAVKVKGEISDVCAVKGCWMTIKDGEQEMRVTFKDYGFFVPKDVAGKTAIMEGIAKVETISVETLRHYAEDAGESAEEIAKITKPEEELTFEAIGVIIQ